LSPILGIFASSQLVALPSSYESIATTTVGSGGASTITFSSIPSTYQHLQIRSIARGPNADTQTTLRIRLNSDTGSNYSYHRLIGTGSAASSTGGGAFDYSYFYFGSSGTTTGSNVFGVSVIDILDYANTSKNTTLRFLGGIDSNGDGGVGLGSSAWYNTAAVNTLTLSADGGGNCCNDGPH
jgi:hypothetical protein